MLPESATRLRTQDRVERRRGARTSVRIVRARWNIWTYTPDLAKTAESQATRYSTVERSGSRTKYKSIGTIA